MKTLLKRTSSLLFGSSPLATDLGLLLMRLWFGVVMALAHGLPKFAKLDAFAAGLARDGVPMPELMAHLAALTEFVGGFLIALGLLTRPAALGLVITMCVAAFVRHIDDPFSKMEFALLYALGFLALLVAGPGRLSLDALISKKLDRAKDLPTAT
jgi:putative oxidoreductase